MAQSRDILVPWVMEALQNLGGQASIIAIAKEIWSSHSKDIKDDEKLFYQWHYDMRWAGDILAKAGKIDRKSRRGVWKVI